MNPQLVTLPGGAQLAPGESPLVGDRFMFSTIAFYLHTEWCRPQCPTQPPLLRGTGRIP
jgi:hypothetical protein